MVSKIITGKFKCSTNWGAPCLVKENGENVHSVESVIIYLINDVYTAELVGVGAQSNMGHGCGSGYKQSGLYVKDLGITIIPEDYVSLQVTLVW